MPKRWRIKPNRNFRENARLVLPVMVDDFLSHKDRVINHPRLKLELHRMRLVGKTLRYAMETFEPGFEEEFSLRLEEVKQLLDTMGRIHDCDINIPRLQGFLKELRVFNRLRPDRRDRLPTSAFSKIIREQSELRRGLFIEMSSTMHRWERDNFKLSLFQSMESEKHFKG
jgi:CHAD domain-containing protein